MEGLGVTLPPAQTLSQEHEDTYSNGDVSNIEYARSDVAYAEIDEVYDVAIMDEPIDQIARAASKNEGKCKDERCSGGPDEQRVYE